MVKFTISKAIFDNNSSLRVGLVILKNYDNKEIDNKIIDLIRKEEENIRKNLDKSKLSEIEKIKVWREAYSKFGAKPKKYKASVESLLRRILDNQELPSINNLVNIYNLISIKNLFPLGADDITKLKDDIHLTYAKGDESFQAINSDEIKNPDLGEIVYKTNNDILCRRWNWRESDLTKIDESTKDIIIYCESLTNDKDLDNALKELKELVGGESFILDKNNNSLNLSNLKLSENPFNEFYGKEKEELKKKEKKPKEKKENKGNEQESMHWADQTARKIVHVKGDKGEYVLAAGITPSGTIHIGNFREIITQELVQRALISLGKKARFIYSWDDMDVMRKVPKNLPMQDKLKEELRKPVCYVFDPHEKYNSYSEYFEKEMEKDLPSLGIYPEFIYQHKEYEKCKYAEEIKVSLENEQNIRDILNKYRKDPLAKDWSLVFVFCDKCKRDTIKKLEWKGGYEIFYQCDCGHEETFDFRKKGIITMRWRIDWPARWHYYHEDFESAGKDHFAAGGSITTSRLIQKEVFGSNPPLGFMYEWIAIKGQGEFASSLGRVITVKEMMEVYEPEIIRYLFASTRPNVGFNISFDLDVIKIYEDFDKTERIYYDQEEVSDKEKLKQKRIYELSCIEKPNDQMPLQPSFRHLTNITQIYENDFDKIKNYYKIDDDFDLDRLKTRLKCAQNWLEKFAPDDMKFKIIDNPSVNLEEKEKKMLSELKEVLVKKDYTEEELFNEFYTIIKGNDSTPKEFFKICYNVLIDKDRGPKLAPFILEIGRKRVTSILDTI